MSAIYMQWATASRHAMPFGEVGGTRWETSSRRFGSKKPVAGLKVLILDA